MSIIVIGCDIPGTVVGAGVGVVDGKGVQGTGVTNGTDVGVGTGVGVGVAVGGIDPPPLGK